MLMLVALNDSNAKESITQALQLGYPGCDLSHTNSGKGCFE